MIETILGIVGSIIMFCLIVVALLGSLILLGLTIFMFIIFVMGIINIIF